MPAYNEEESIREAVLEIHETILSSVPNSELLVVNDGSSDSTKAKLDELRKSVPCLRVIHQKNAGHGPAIYAGSCQASSDFLFLLDSDRQIPIQSFYDFWKVRASYQAVFGIRAVRHDPVCRLILTCIVRVVLFVFLRVKIRDPNIPFKLIRREVWENAKQVIAPNSRTPSLLLAAFVHSRRLPVIDIVVPHNERKTGVASLNLRKLGPFCWQAFLEVLEFRRRLNK
jgi:dolichol-phosphate mannosyltransferase